MSERMMIPLLDRLERLAAYEGPWRPLRREAARVRVRVEELREREARLDDLLVIALVGGSGVGKSTLLNALAGDRLAATSEFRPCTTIPTVYHPPGAKLPFEGWTRVSRSALEHLAIVDTPDSDTVVREHRQTVIDALRQCDLIVICGSPEKYLDEATWSLLRPLQGERGMICVETKASADAESIRDHWLARLTEQGFETTRYFRVSARRAFDRKLSGAPAGADEFEFAALEAFLREELTRERIQRIKRSNAAGLLTKTVASLQNIAVMHQPALELLRAGLAQAEAAVLEETVRCVREDLFGEPHLWHYAMGRELGMRAKGIVGSCFRLLEGLRTLPTRLAGWMAWFSSASRSGRQAAALLADSALVNGELHLIDEEIRKRYLNKQSEMALQFVQTEFDPPSRDADLAGFEAAVEERLAAFLRGPARERLVAWARRLTSWPVTLLSDAGPVAFLGYTAYRIVRDYFTVQLLPIAFFLYSGTVLAIILGVELVALSAFARTAAWSTRRGSLKDVYAALGVSPLAFQAERQVLAATQELIDDIQGLNKELPSSSSE